MWAFLKKKGCVLSPFAMKNMFWLRLYGGKWKGTKAGGRRGLVCCKKKSCSVCRSELGSNHILHAKVPCEMSQKHVRLLIIAETDVSCLSTEGGEGCVSGMGLICPLRQVLRGAGADTINLMLRAVPRNSTGHWEHSWLIHMENLCQRYAFTPALLFPVMWYS